MKYPTIEEVKKANRANLARWYRFLLSPGQSAINEERETFQKVMDKEAIVMSLITDRFNAMGGFTPEISKQIG